MEGGVDQEWKRGVMPQVMNTAKEGAGGKVWGIAVLLLMCLSVALVLLRYPSPPILAEQEHALGIPPHLYTT